MPTAMKLLRTFGPVVLGVAAGFVAATPWATGLSLSAEARECGGGPNRIAAEIRLGAARDVWLHLPALAETPELEGDTRPATLVVFDGRFDTRALAFAVPDVPAYYDRAICVLQADGTANIYFDVSRAGSRYDS